MPASDASFVLYPNPATDYAMVGVPLVPTDDAIEVAVFDVLGRDVVVGIQGQTAADVATFQLDLSRLSPGSYFVRIVRSGKEQVEKLIVQ